MGYQAGFYHQSTNSISIGYQAGYSNQGVGSIAIGYQAGYDTQAPSSIVINALQSPLNVTNPGFYVAPLRDITLTQNHLLAYDSTISEIGFVNGGSWSLYQAISSIALTSINPRIIDPSNLGMTIQTNGLSIKDNNEAPSYTYQRGVFFNVSSSQEQYIITNDPGITGSVSSLGLGRFDNINYTAGSLYVSSLYLGALGGTPAGQVTTDATATNLYFNTNQMLTNKMNFFPSTLGPDNVQLFPEDSGKYFYYLNSLPNTINLPEASNGWNVYVSLNSNALNSITLNTTATDTLTQGGKGYLASDGVSFYFI